MRNYNELKESAFNSGEKFISNYFLTLNHSFLAKGIVINKILENASTEEFEKFIDSAFTEETKKKYLRMTSDKEIKPVAFETGYDYIKFMEKSFKRSEYTKDEDIKFEKLKILSEVLDHINIIGGFSSEQKIDNVLLFLNDNVSEDFSSKINNIFIDEPIYLEQETKDSSLVPDLKEIFQGKRKFLTINDIYDIFPEFFSYGPQELFFMPISKANDTNGENIFEFLHSISRSSVESSWVNNDEDPTKKYHLTNQAHLFERQNVLMKFGEIEDELEKYSNQVKKHKSKFELDKLNKNIMNIIRLEQNFYQVSKVSSSDEVSRMFLGFKHILNNNIKFMVEEIKQNVDKFSNINEIFPNNDQEEWKREITHAKIVELIKSNDDFTNDLLESLNNNIQKTEKQFKTLLRNNKAQSTNIPMILRNNEKKIKNMKTDETLLKEIFYSIAKKRPLHVYSDPGTGKTSNIKQVLNTLGWQFLEIENAVDSETYVKNINDDGKQLIGKEARHVRKSDLSRAKESGEECIVLYADEFAGKAMGLKALGLAEALNKTLDDIITTPNLYFMATSNQNLSNSHEIAASLDDRFDSLHLGSANWEDETYIQSKLLDLHFSSFSNVFEMTEQKLWIDTIKEIYNMKEKVFPNFYEIKKDKSSNECLNGLQYIIDTYDVNTDNFDKIIDNFQEINKNQEASANIRTNIGEIHGAIYLENIYKEIIDKETLIKEINSDDKMDSVSKSIAKKEALSKYEFQKVLSYLDDNTIKIDDIRHPSNIEDMVDFVYDKIKFNQTVQFEKFYMNIEEEKEFIAKEKISFTLKQIVHKFNINTLSFFGKETTIIPNIIKAEPKLEKRLNLITTELKTVSKEFVNSEFLSTLPLYKNMYLLTGTFLINNINLHHLKTKNYKYKNGKFRSSELLAYKFDSVVSKEDNKLIVHSKYSEVQKMYDLTYLLGKIASKLNFYIRTDVQNLNENHEYDDMADFDDSKESINKFFYRNLINLLKEYYIASNSKEGVDLSKLFKRHIGKIEKLIDKDEFNSYYEEILKDISKNYKNEVSNSGMFIQPESN